MGHDVLKVKDKENRFAKYFAFFSYTFHLIAFNMIMSLFCCIPLGKLI